MTSGSCRKEVKAPAKQHTGRGCTGLEQEAACVEGGTWGCISSTVSHFLHLLLFSLSQREALFERKEEQEGEEGDEETGEGEGGEKDNGGEAWCTV